MDADDEVVAPGWDAIDAALARVYGSQRPRHVGYVPPMHLSHNLQGCSAYDAGDHWHYVTYGLSELYEPHPDDDPRFSKWGFELTLRLVKAGRDQPPEWPFTMLNGVANHVNSQTVLLEPGDRVDVGRPITGCPDVTGAPDTALTVLAATLDPQLGVIDTPNGQVTFLQLVGVTAAEKQLMLETSSADVLARLAVGNPRLLTDPARAWPSDRPSPEPLHG